MAVHRCNRQAVDLQAAAPPVVVHRVVDPPVVDPPVAVRPVAVRPVAVHLVAVLPVVVHREAVLRVVVRLEADRPAVDLPVAACLVVRPAVVPRVHPVDRWAVRQAA